jgi:hypothetical protein
MEGDLGVQLIVGCRFLRDVKAMIDVGTGEIRFRIRVDNIFFKFQHRERQRIMIHGDHNESGIWGEPQP